jgi:hypothetical protein
MKSWGKMAGDEILGKLLLGGAHVDLQIAFSCAQLNTIDGTASMPISK